MKWLPTRKNKVEAFWKWFKENERDYFGLNRGNQEELFAVLERKLQKVNKHLVFEFSVEPQGGKREFTISADGMLDAFDAVFDLHEAAPELEFFDVVAFRQPSEEEFSVEFGSRKLTWNDVYYTAFHDVEHEEVSMTLYVKGLTKDNEDELAPALFILLDSVIGEYNMGVHVGNIEFRPFEAQTQAQPIQTVKAFFPVEAL
ncbi:hypothetical protein HU147_09465 [Planomicrobium chinense]|uniref:hypothetical protein n=1 Tax=Planococcus chinensis TaxID=272917 RepID=UPI001CC6E4CF|nr:hypothetical protein [Planococcus chinensis]MBZ5201440.1 hypothetical protein [Planococcus chinensis]MCP2035344.1 hypothetical protein [Planomicrobium sp. HSC-17F08]